jgi:hypothetical protein
MEYSKVKKHNGCKADSVYQREYLTPAGGAFCSLEISILPGQVEIRHGIT